MKMWAAMLVMAVAAQAGTLEMEYTAKSGTPANSLSGSSLSGTCWNMRGDDRWGRTDADMASFQVWQYETPESRTIVWGGRGATGKVCWVVMACPNVNFALTNAPGNRFEIWELQKAGGWNGTAWNFGSASFMDETWSHHAVQYTPSTMTWRWWKNGVYQGQSVGSYAAAAGDYGATWTNNWQTNSVLILQHNTFIGQPAGVRPELDYLAEISGTVTDDEIHRNFLGWSLRRKGVTQDDPFGLECTFQGIARTVPNTTVASTNMDAIIVSNTWNETRFDQRVNVKLVYGSATWGISVAAPYEMMCNVISNSVNGEAAVTVTATNTVGKSFVKAYPYTGSMTSKVERSVFIAGGVAGSARENASSWVDARVGTGARNLWATFDPANTNYVRTSNNWAFVDSVGMEAASVWNSWYNSGGVSPTLVAPDLVVGCAHSQVESNTVIRWVTRAGDVVHSTVMAVTQLKPGSVYTEYPDVSLARIFPPVTNITCAPIMPTNAWLYFAPQYVQNYGVTVGHGVPCVKISQAGRVDCFDLSSLSTNGWAGYVVPVTTNRLAYYSPVVGGDSGNPSFMMLNGTAVVVNVWTTGGGGSYFGGISNELWTAAAVRVGSTNRVTRFGLGGFTEY
jgi:hypothetical protein